MSSWIDDLRQRHGEDVCLVTVMDVRGSAPRETGAKMLVTASDINGTIGGGQLEYQCTKIACDALEKGEDEAPGTFARTFTLGANCGQCCGGVVDVLFEKITAVEPVWINELQRLYDARIPTVIATSVDADRGFSKYLITQTECRGFAAPLGSLDEVTIAARRIIDGSGPARRIRTESGDGRPQSVLFEPLMPSTFNFAIFGAGHVGSAVVATMAGLEGNLRWFDSRRNVFPATVPRNVTCIESERPELEVAAMPGGSYFLVMTHSHALDYAISDAVLRRGDFAYLGLIGSVSKRRRFERLMRKQGMARPLLDRLTCPIGIAGVGGKKPGEIAISVAAELLQTRNALAAAGAERHADCQNVHRLRR